MDQLTELFRKLNEEFAQKAPPGQLLLTIKQIEAYLIHSNAVPVNHIIREEIVQELPLPAYQNVTIVERPAPLQERVMEHPIMQPQQSVIAPNIPPKPIVPAVDLHETLPAAPASINDQLKKEVLELGDLLNEAPVRDLKKAIGLNDRYVFIATLFNGDEGFYERCIKTLNAFSVLQEAEYWVKRELALKLGWQDENPTVRHFYQLLKRRFS